MDCKTQQKDGREVGLIELWKVAEVMMECSEMRVTLRGILVGSSITTACTLIGSLAGPLGLITGASLGALVAVGVTKNRFKSGMAVLREDMTDEQRERLWASLRVLLSHLPADLPSILMALLKDRQLGLKLIHELYSFLTSQGYHTSYSTPSDWSYLVRQIPSS